MVAKLSTKADHLSKNGVFVVCSLLTLDESANLLACLARPANELER
jgi:hypothetical protein